jgi:release factor glutamine methyltransferase
MTSTAAQPSTPSLAPRVARIGDLDIAYDERVLTPRPWTAAQSRWAAELLEEAPPGPVLELCAGAGHIGLGAVVASSRRLVAVDADAVACAYARGNAAAAGLADRVEVRHATLDTALAADEQFPVIIADPPWVPSARTLDYPDDPLLAIDGGDDGLEIARRCLAVARSHLAPGGAMLLQLGTVAQADVLQEVGGGLVLTEVRRPAPNGVVACFRRPPGGR